MNNKSLIWSSNKYNFDTISSSILTVYEMSTGDNLYKISRNLIDNVGVGEVQKEWNNRSASIFVIISVVICSWVIKCLFIAITVESYKECSEDGKLRKLYTPLNIKHWEDIEFTMKHKEMKDGILKNKLNCLARIFLSDYYKITIAIIILCDFIMILTNSYSNSNGYNTFLTYIRYFFTILFLIENILKIISYGKYYFKNVWNYYEIMILLCSIVQIFFPSVCEGLDFNIFRIYRFLLLLSRNKYINTIYLTLWHGLFNVEAISLMFLVYVSIYSTIGLELFSNYKYGSYINEQSNFNTWYNSLKMVIRIISSDNWINIMNELIDGNNNSTQYFYISFFINDYVILII